jgi:bifunctional UDP-N-acetylglucosamine pyrophosphorylase/glucosamine-1-phosphate N-acetyltransferase
VKVGNFVEIKKSTMLSGAKANHLAYIGDGKIGKQTNIGAGSIFCNYDGKNKYETIIGDNVFIGSNTSLIAPLKIGNEALIAAGSVIISDVPSESLAISRAPQKNKIGLGKKIMMKIARIRDRLNRSTSKRTN